METKRTIEEMLADLDKQYQKEQELADFIQQNRRLDSVIPVYCFFSTGGNLIATVQDFGDYLRLSRFATCGPMGHLDIKDTSKIGYELRMEGYEVEPSDKAAETLEQWATQPEWAKGLRQALFLAYWNTLSFYGHYELTRQMDTTNDMEAAITLGAGFCKELGYKAL